MELWGDAVAKPVDHPLPGPLVTREFFNQLAVAGESLVQYDQYWRVKSGVSEYAIVGKLHHMLVESLRWMVCVDQLDPSRLVCGEMAVRNLLRTEAAVSRNPKQPDWEGLDIYSTSAM